MNTATALTALQQRFAQQVQNGNPLQPDLSELSGHMAIYIHAYQARMREALADNFPVLHRALGDAGFATLAAAYCTAHPSRQRSIRWLGNGLVDFMAANPASLPHPALHDLARMDWAMRAAFDAADADCLRFEDLAAVAASDWPALHLQLVPAVRLLELQWAVEDLWHALHADADAQTREPVAAPHAMLVWRWQLECRWRSIGAQELQALRLVHQGASFADVCAALQQDDAAAAAQQAATLLRNWVAEGLLVRP